MTNEKLDLQKNRVNMIINGVRTERYAHCTINDEHTLYMNRNPQRGMHYTAVVDIVKEIHGEVINRYNAYENYEL